MNWINQIIKSRKWPIWPSHDCKCIPLRENFIHPFHTCNILFLDALVQVKATTTITIRFRMTTQQANLVKDGASLPVSLTSWLFWGKLTISKLYQKQPLPQEGRERGNGMAKSKTAPHQRQMMTIEPYSDCHLIGSTSTSLTRYCKVLCYSLACWIRCGKRMCKPE